MINEIHSYPKIYAIGHGAIAELFQGQVLVEEKVDGSQFSFTRVGGELKLRSRGAKVYPDNAGMFSLAVAAVNELADFLHEGWTYRAEYLAKPKHNVLCYQRVPKFNLVLFDINTGEETYLDRGAKEVEAARLSMEITPVLYVGTVASPEPLYDLLKRESILGGPVEGIVVKNYTQFGGDKKVMMGKFVTESFKETHNKEWKADNPSVGDVIDRIIATLRSDVRWAKSVQRLRDAGKLEGSPKDIGMLIREIQADIKSEELEFVQQKLTEFALPRVLRASTAGFPEWYKKQLMESAFTEVA